MIVSSLLQSKPAIPVQENSTNHSHASKLYIKMFCSSVAALRAYLLQIAHIIYTISNSNICVIIRLAYSLQ